VSVYQGINPRTLRPMFRHFAAVGRLSKYSAKHTAVLRTSDLCLWLRKAKGLEGAQRVWVDEGAKITYRLAA
jgi:hypothetical protein